MIELATIENVMRALGGRMAVARLVGVGPTATSNWKKTGRFPAITHAVMTEALAARGFTAPPALWGQVAAQAVLLAGTDAQASISQ